MSLTFEQLESVTNDYFVLDNGKATDIYFQSSYLLNLLLKQQKGLWKRPTGGIKVRIPLKYDGAEAGFYGRGDTLSSDKRENVNAAYFTLAHAYGNATIMRLDTLENSGPEAMVDLALDEVETAQTSLTKVLAESIYDLPSGDNKRLTGIRAMCNETIDLPYGNIAEQDLNAEDGTRPWEGKMIATAEAITTTIIRNMATQAKVRDGQNGKPDIAVLPEELFNIIVDTLTIQQRFTKSEDTAKAGFTGVEFEGKILTPDDFCPDGHLFLLNSKHIGFAVHTKGFFTRGPWRVVQDSPEDKTMKIYFDGNLICNNRKAHIGHSNLS
jgi:hypothetical protein